MDLFKFTVSAPNTDPTVLEKGMFINKADKITWVERYSDPGEFEIVAKLSTGMKDFLPEGTLLSHTGTMEVMIVESCEISETKDTDPDVTITGRTFDSWLENRILGTWLARGRPSVGDYWIVNDVTWNQIVTVLKAHISGLGLPAGFTADPNDALGNVTVRVQPGITGTGTSEDRVLAPTDLSSFVQEMLAIDNLGFRSIRRNTFGVVGLSTSTVFEVYRGVDRSNKVIFSYKHGDLDQIQYLFSKKKLKTSALVKGKFVWVVVDTGPVKYDRRQMLVDGGDIDGHLETMPTGATLSTIQSRMATRGRQALKKQEYITISQADISPTTNNVYRRDYNLGDLIMLDTNFGQRMKMRVTEYAEIQDENGYSGHPTLSVPTSTGA